MLKNKTMIFVIRKKTADHTSRTQRKRPNIFILMYLRREWKYCGKKICVLPVDKVKLLYRGVYEKIEINLLLL